MNTDTPLPQEEPAGQNPPDGAIIDYYLDDNAKKVTLEIRDMQHTLIRTYSNTDSLYKIPKGNVPPYWIRPQQLLPSAKGSHRVTWDMHYQPMNETATYPIAATYMNTAPNATSPWVMPGIYRVVLNVDGKKITQYLEVRMDPRVKTTTQGLQQQHALSMQCYNGKIRCNKLLQEIRDVRSGLNIKMKTATADQLKHLRLQDEAAAKLDMNASGKEIGLTRLSSTFASLINVLQQSDNAPSSQVMAAIVETNKQLERLTAQWGSLKNTHH
jgi:hypothetical protein